MIVPRDIPAAGLAFVCGTLSTVTVPGIKEVPLGTIYKNSVIGRKKPGVRDSNCISENISNAATLLFTLFVACIFGEFILICKPTVFNIYASPLVVKRIAADTCEFVK